MRLAKLPSFFYGFADKELNLEHWCGILHQLRLNITKSKILHHILIMEILSSRSLFITVH
jgi:hypothetical protein